MAAVATSASITTFGPMMVLRDFNVKNGTKTQLSGERVKSNLVKQICFASECFYLPTILTFFLFNVRTKYRKPTSFQVSCRRPCSSSWDLEESFGVSGNIQLELVEPLMKLIAFSNVLSET